MSNENIDLKMLKGFNAGYLLSKYEPELLRKLMESFNKNHSYLQGLKLGSQQYDKETLLNQLKNHDRSKDTEIDR